ncbi:selenide, water dikinase SelD [Maritimibacter sp. UBA3975]|uniref:selenide, water dikinase SelD n=1 Tax=Maritimibacter sp. UBA3975 TaxID=1946833 RepID=UPI000C0B0321|nr:selenide, water dikinase SelD [Maritimibacter sp. UBA3975]MAM60770.1 selenide, water dikinase SelD [Maritimibacter sp.]|tara:strand:- start:31211 stop:33397 length:2187 start_codon:yes stop_codon:yes gene_type:complete
MQPQIPLTRDLVLIGGGHAHALALRKWGMAPLPGVRLTLINPGPTAPYSGMLPGHIAGHYSRTDLDIDLVRLARFAGARLILGAVDGLDAQARTVHVAGRGDIGYDVASVDIGIHAEMPGIEGFADHGIGAKPLDRYASAWERFVAEVVDGGARPEVAVIGGGVAGTELSLAMSHRLTEAGASPRVTLIEAGPDLTGFTPRALSSVRTALADHGVEVLTGSGVAQVAPDHVILVDGRTIPAALTVGAAGAFAHSWLADTALPTTSEGFLRVGPTLQVEGHPELFAVGDCAHLTETPRPKAGVFAVRAAPVLAANLKAALSGGPMRSFRPQKDFLKLVSLGGKSALASKWSLAAAGPLLWQWKNRIDQKFMDRFRHLPDMTAPGLPAQVADGVRAELGTDAQMLCAGCGSKVGPDVLAAALARMQAGPGRKDVLSGPGDDAAVLDIGGVRQVLTTDHLRAFTEDPALFARIAAVHALGDIWAMGAEPQAALVSITLPRQSEPLQARVIAEIMAAAEDVITAAGAQIVGGHSTMGAEMVLGFTLTGLAPRDPISVAGAKPGDAVILTRPIGTGTLLAGEMQGKADGRDVAEVLATMARPQGAAAAALAGAHAMTDVTGFGLAGHLAAICKASGVGAEIDLSAVPTYPGARALAAQGVRSTIHAANVAAAPVAGMGDNDLMALLHDPQTAGGFLAVVSPDDVAGCLAAIAATGEPGVVIRRIVEGAGLSVA